MNEQWYDLRPKDATEIPLIEVGRVKWIPGQMINNLEINPNQIEKLLEQIIKKQEYILLTRKRNDKKNTALIRSIQSDGTALMSATDERKKESKSSVESETDRYTIAIDFDALLSELRGQMSNKLIGRLVDRELKSSLHKMVMLEAEDILLSELLIAMNALGPVILFFQVVLFSEIVLVWAQLDTFNVNKIIPFILILIKIFLVTFETLRLIKSALIHRGKITKIVPEIIPFLPFLFYFAKGEVFVWSAPTFIRDKE